MKADRLRANDIISTGSRGFRVQREEDELMVCFLSDRGADGLQHDLPLDFNFGHQCSQR